MTNKICNVIQNEYDFDIPFALIDAKAYLGEMTELPKWWEEEYFRLNALFYLEPMNQNKALEIIQSLNLKNEEVFVGRLGLYWAVHQKETYSQSAYANQLMKTPLYKQVTIRNRNTTKKIAQLIQQMKQVNC